MAIDKSTFSLDVIYYPANTITEELVIGYPTEGASSGVIYIHGHGSHAFGSLRVPGQHLIRAGYATCLPTMSGYGFSEGKPDYCGKNTLIALNEAVELFLKESELDPKKVIIWGNSRGAICVAQMLIENKFQFKAAILQSGAYDLVKDYYHPQKMDGIKMNMRQEIDGDLNIGLQNRSIIEKVGQIKTPILLLHGEEDENINVEQARLLDEQLNQFKIEHTTYIIPHANHFLIKERKEIIWPFLSQNLK